jgi:hypothetical protein
MGQKLFDGSMMPEYGDGAPVSPVEKGNIDIAANNYASHMKSIGQAMHVYEDGPIHAIIPKVNPIGQDMTDQQSVRLYKKTGGHLGRFASADDANEYAKWLYKKAREIATYFPDEDIINSSTAPEEDAEFAEQIKQNRRDFEAMVRSGSGMQAKGLGQTIRRVGRSVEKYDPNAIDGDNDGMVQEGTPWVRPALPGSPAISSLRSTSGGSRSVSKDAVEAAKAAQKVIRKNEPEVTKKIKDIEAASGGAAKLADLDKRFKTLDSLAKKIERLKGNFDGDIAATATQMNDALRYTFVVDDTDNYSEFVKSALSTLRADGSRVTTWNYWQSKDPYSGVNAMIQDPRGFNYEIQFHTKASLAAKKKNEPLYQAFKNETDSAVRKDIYDRMKSISSGLKKPRGNESIGRSVSRDHRVATFTPELTLLSTRSTRSSSGGRSGKLGEALFPKQDGLPLSQREQRKLKQFTEETWLPAVMATVQGTNFQWPGYDGPRISGLRTTPQNARMIEDIRAEVLAAIVANYIPMMESGDFSFLAWIPVDKDGSTDWWDKKVAEVLGFPEALKFPLGEHPFSRDRDGNARRNTIPEMVKALGRSVEGGMGRRNVEQSIGEEVEELVWETNKFGDLIYDTSDSANIKKIPVIDPVTGKQKTRKVKKYALSTNVSVGDDGGEYGDTFGTYDADNPERANVSIDVDESSIDARFTGEKRIETTGSDITIDKSAPVNGRFVKLPNLDDKDAAEKAYNNLYAKMKALIADENARASDKEQVSEEIFQRMNEISPALAKLIVDRTLGGLTKEEFEQRWKGKLGVTQQVIDALYPDNRGSARTGTDPFRGLAGIFGQSSFSDSRQSAEWADAASKIREEFIRAMGANNQQQVKAIADVSRKFNIPDAGVRLLIEGVVSSRGAYQRGPTSENAIGSAISTALKMFESGKSKNEILGEMYTILKGKSPGELTTTRMGTIRRDVAKALGIQPSELVAWLAEKGINIKSDESFGVDKRGRLVERFSYKSIDSSYDFRDLDEEALPPDW